MSIPLSTGTYSINGRKYRKTAYQLKVGGASATEITVDQFEDTPDVYEDEPSIGCIAPPPGLPALKQKIAKAAKKSETTVSMDPQPTEDERITVVGGKKWMATIQVPACFIGKLIGMNRRALNSLENDTQCRVKTPRREQKDKPCEITSIISLECVQRCLDRIEIFVDDARKSSRPTHFVAFSCDHSEIQQNFEVFKKLVMDSDEFHESTRNPQLFTKTSRLHLTISVVRLFDELDMKKMEEAFRVIHDEIKPLLDSAPLIADIQGIDMMNDDPSQVSVIYAKIKGEKVQKIANLVSRRLMELLGGNSGNSEDVVADSEDVKLHMTLMNSRYVTQQSDKKNSKNSFNAKKMLEELKELHFGTIQINEVIN
ncbi:hypothetical protein CRE_08549 [Caenorhabditis remanei]|uniref:K Homology domain-containing protein n=1 Tax=Caenorhabditis remanei TaxID=31234 RepID=E3NBA4_CAERE|nr:hypothetical protein CRE_08549 [Caenorhabditis remanei]